MRLRVTSVVIAVLAVVAIACTGARPGSGARSQNLITRAEIEEQRSAGVRDLQELVERLRPRWLTIRSERSLQLQTIVLVYLNNARLGGIEVLRGYPISDGILSLRYLDSAQAGLLPGAGSAHVEGAIVISTQQLP